MPFTPNESEQRLPPTYYRGCWHVVSRGLFIRYRHQLPFLSVALFFPYKRILQPFGLHHPRGVAPSGLLPLRNILSCCLPWESGPCLSPNVAVHPLRPAIHRRLGRLLPCQLANGPQAHLKAIQKYLSTLVICGITRYFYRLSPTSRQILTCYSPVRR